MTIPIALGATFVRFGNFFNSEIVGKYTGNNFGVVFLNNKETLPRHPAQLYEAFCYLVLFFALRLVFKSERNRKPGQLFGIFFTGMFSIRFLIEFVKESQGGLEEQLGIFSTGQWLSIPFILMGIGLMIYSYLSIEKK